jgi:hypothetical protein
MMSLEILGHFYVCLFCCENGHSALGHRLEVIEVKEMLKFSIWSSACFFVETECSVDGKELNLLVFSRMEKVSKSLEYMHTIRQTPG